MLLETCRAFKGFQVPNTNTGDRIYLFKKAEWLVDSTEYLHRQFLLKIRFKNWPYKKVDPVNNVQYESDNEVSLDEKWHLPVRCETVSKIWKTKTEEELVRSSSKYPPVQNFGPLWSI